MNKLQFVTSRLSLGFILASIITALSTLYMVYDTDSVYLVSIFSLAFVFSLLGYFIKFLLDKILLHDNAESILILFLHVFIIVAVAGAVTYLFSFLPDSFFDLFRVEKVDFLPLQRKHYNFGICSIACLGLIGGMFVRRPNSETVYADPNTLAISMGLVSLCYFFKCFFYLPRNPGAVQNLPYSVLLFVIIIFYSIISSQKNTLFINYKVKEFSENKDTKEIRRNYLMLLSVIPIFIVILVFSRYAVNGASIILNKALYEITGSEQYLTMGDGIRRYFDIGSVIFFCISLLWITFHSIIKKIFNTLVKLIKKA